MAARGNLVWRARRSRFRTKKGAIEQLYTAPPAGSVVVCLDEMGPQASNSYPGQRVVRTSAGKRATQEIDDGRRGVAGYVFGAFQPATGAALTAPYEGRTTANWVDFLCRVEGWIDPTAERIDAVMDNLDRKSTRLNSSHSRASRMPSSA